jgi:hypothetical protein
MVFAQVHTPALQVGVGWLQLCGDASKKHPWASCAQLATAEELAHAPLTEVHTGSALHLQEAVPSGPMHVWRVPGHRTGRPQSKHPFCKVQVARPPGVHFVWLCTHWFVQHAPALHAPFVHVVVAAR